MKTSELQGAALDWAVAKCEGKDNDCEIHAGNVMYGRATSGFIQYRPSTDWAQGGPIIEREGVEVTKGNPLYFPKGNEKGDYYEPLWIARKPQDNLPPGVRGVYEKWGPTPLIAAMRCLVASKLGDDIELPRN